VRLDVDPTRLEADQRMRDRACKHAPDGTSRVLTPMCRLCETSPAL
jgi:hypothetical protein